VDSLIESASRSFWPKKRRSLFWHSSTSHRRIYTARGATKSSKRIRQGGNLHHWRFLAQWT